MHISDYEHFGRDSGQYTYVSDAHMTTSWLDHYICSANMHSNIDNITFLDKPPSSDHLPISTVFRYSVTAAATDDDSADESLTYKI